MSSLTQQQHVVVHPTLYMYSAPDYFDPTTIARHLGDNWALKSSNLRKLTRNLEQFLHTELQQHYDSSPLDTTKIAKAADPAELTTLVEMVAAAAVTCPDKGTYVQRIMSMTPDAQMAMKQVIEESMGKMSEYRQDGQEDDDDDMDEDGSENELVFGEETAKETASELEEQLDAVRKELARQKMLAQEAGEESSRNETKLQSLVEDLQDRLMKRQDELIDVEEELQKATSSLEETQSQLSELQEEKAALADDLDVAQAKAQQLYKAEATVVAYKKRLDAVGSMNQQNQDLEDQAEKYLQQIMELEAEVKKSNALQRTVTSQEGKIAKLEKELAAAGKSTDSDKDVISDLKSRCQAAENAKKMFEDELSELRARADVSSSVDVSTMSSDRLVEENKKLRKQVENLSMAAAKPIAAMAVSADGKEPAAPIAIAVPAVDDTPEVAALKGEIQRLCASFNAKQAEMKKITSEKEKLEAYTKRTLSKFQDKYLVALQECKSKLKEKQDKIEQLEKRSQSERQAQKREERLLSSTIYELGLAIMQSKLKSDGNPK